MNTPPKKAMPHTTRNTGRGKGLILIGLALLTLGLVWQGPGAVSATFLLQSPLPTEDPAEEIPVDDEPDVPADDMAAVDESFVCATKSKQCITFEYLREHDRGNGDVFLHFRVINNCTKKVKWIEVVSREWQPVAPAHNDIYFGSLGNYSVRWIDDAPAAPRRLGYRFNPQFNTFKDGVTETLTLAVSDFNPKRRIRIRAKVGNEIKRAGLRPSRLDCAQLVPTATPPSPQDICFTRTKQRIVFDFYGYMEKDNGETDLAFGITNPRQRKLDAVGFQAKKWVRVSPSKRKIFTGSLGNYKVQWIKYYETPNQEAYRFKPQGNWFRNGANDIFTITVTDFDPTKRITAWVQSGNQWIEAKARLSEHACNRTPPTPTPRPTNTPTATSTPTPTPPDSPLPTPTKTATPLPTITPTPIVLPNGWHRRIDEEAGFQIDYPMNSKLSAGKSKGQSYSSTSIGFVLTDIHGYQGMVIDVFENLQSLPIDQYVNQLYEELFLKSPPAALDVTPRSIGEQVGYQVDFFPGNTELQVLIPSNDKVYALVLVHDFHDSQPAPEAVDLFEQILDTFSPISQ